MTTPGPVVDQPSVPATAAVGRPREAGSKNNAVGQGGEQEAGFGDVLSRLRGENDPSSDGAVPPKAAGRSGERASLWRHEIEARLAPGEGQGDPELGAADEIEPGADTLLEAMPGGAPETNAMGVDAATVNDIAAAVGLAPQQPAVGGKIDTRAHAAAHQAADPASVAMAALDAKAPVEALHAGGAQAADPASAALAALHAEAQAEPLQAGGAQDALDAVGAAQRAAAADPMLARLGVRGSSLDKDKSSSVDGSATSTTAIDPSLTQAADGSGVRTQRHEASAANQPPKASILRQETHFAPVAPAPSSGHHADAAARETAKPDVGSEPMSGEAAHSVEAAQPSFEGSLSVGGPPAQQIADRVAAEAASTPAFADRAGMTPEQPGTKPALKILHIALQPGDLGTVTVRMELKDTELTLHVEAERAETADLIRNDQDTLSKLLRSAGYSLEAGTIRVADAASAPSGQNGTQTNLQSSPQSQSGASERQEHGHRGSGGANGGDRRPQASRNDTHETTTNRAGVGLYI